MTACRSQGCDRSAAIRGMCMKHYNRWRRVNGRRCSVPGCTGAVEGRDLCVKHYTRLVTTGSTGLRPRPTRRLATSGYYQIKVGRDHPCADARGWLYEHRAVVFDQIGFGPHQCHWCQAPVNWRAGLEVDHVDADKHNNDPANLVPACHRCNTTRAMPATPPPRGPHGHFAKRSA